MDSPDSSPMLRRTWIIVGWLGIAVVIYLSLMPRPPQLGIEYANRVGHVIAYAMLMLWFAQLADVPSRRMPYAGGLFALAVSLEFAQLATEFRTFSTLDMAAGGLGVAIGWFLAPPRLPNLFSIVERMVKRRVGN